MRPDTCGGVVRSVEGTHNYASLRSMHTFRPSRRYIHVDGKTITNDPCSDFATVSRNSPSTGIDDNTLSKCVPSMRLLVRVVCQGLQHTTRHVRDR